MTTFSPPQMSQGCFLTTTFLTTLTLITTILTTLFLTNLMLTNPTLNIGEARVVRMSWQEEGW